MSAEVIAADLGPRPLHGQPRHGGRQVHRRDREEPGADLRRGRRGQRGAVLRRGRRHLRQAQRGPRRPRPVRQHRERLPAAAPGDLRRSRGAGDEPARQHRRGVHPPTRRDHRLPGAGCGTAPRAVAAVPRATAARWATASTSASCRVVRLRRRQHPLSLDHGRLSRRRRAAAGRDGCTWSPPSSRSTASSGGWSWSGSSAGTTPNSPDSPHPRPASSGSTRCLQVPPRSPCRYRARRATVGAPQTRGRLAMPEHQYDERIETLRPPAARLEDEVGSHAGKAAAAGRTDALGAGDILGLQRSSRQRRRHLAARGGALAGARRHLLRRATARAGGSHRHGGPDGPRLQRRPRARRHRGRLVGTGGERARLHRRIQHRLPARHVRPDLDAGKTTLAHELTHVVQQRSGPVDGTSAPGGIKVSDPSDRFEREASANAERVMAAPAPEPQRPRARRRPAVEQREPVGRRKRRSRRLKAPSCSARGSGGRGGRGRLTCRPRAEVRHDGHRSTISGGTRTAAHRRARRPGVGRAASRGACRCPCCPAPCSAVRGTPR